MRDRLRKLNWKPFATRAAVVGANFLSMLVIAALMPLGDFGQFVYLWALVLTLSTTVSMGGVAYALREGSARLADPARGMTRAEALWIAALMPGFLLVALTVGILEMAPFLQATLGLGLPEKSTLTLVSLAAFALNLLNHIIIPHRVAERLTLSMLVKDAGPNAMLLLMALALFVNDALKPNSLLIAFALVCLGTTALLLGWLFVGRQQLVWRAPGHPRPRGLRKFWGSAVLGTLAAQTDILLGGLVLNSADLGRYQIVKRLANLIGLPQIVANWVVAVRLGKAAATSDIGALRQLCREGVGLTFWPALVLMLGLVLAMPLFIRLYDLPTDAALWLPFALLVLASFANIAGGVNFMLAAQSGREGQALLARILAVAALTVTVLAVGESLVPWSLALAVLVSGALANTVLCVFLYRGLQIDTSVFSLLKRDLP